MSKRNITVYNIVDEQELAKRIVEEESFRSPEEYQKFAEIMVHEQKKQRDKEQRENSFASIIGIISIIFTFLFYMKLKDYGYTDSIFSFVSKIMFLEEPNWFSNLVTILLAMFMLQFCLCILWELFKVSLKTLFYLLVYVVKEMYKIFVPIKKD